MRIAAFIGFQNYLLQPTPKGKRKSTFHQWCKGFGLLPRAEAAMNTKESEIEAANARIRRLFGKGLVQK